VLHERGGGLLEVDRRGRAVPWDSACETLRAGLTAVLGRDR
jgi:hypothetical protein